MRNLFTHFGGYFFRAIPPLGGGGGGDGDTADFLLPRPLLPCTCPAVHHPAQGPVAPVPARLPCCQNPTSGAKQGKASHCGAAAHRCPACKQQKQPKQREAQAASTGVVAAPVALSVAGPGQTDPALIEPQTPPARAYDPHLPCPAPLCPGWGTNTKPRRCRRPCENHTYIQIDMQPAGSGRNGVEPALLGRGTAVLRSSTKIPFPTVWGQTKCAISSPKPEKLRPSESTSQHTFMPPTNDGLPALMEHFPPQHCNCQSPL